MGGSGVGGFKGALHSFFTGTEGSSAYLATLGSRLWRSWWGYRSLDRAQAGMCRGRLSLWFAATCWHSLCPSHQIRWDQLLNRVWLFATQWIAARQASLSITKAWSSLRLMSIKSVMSSSHLILCRLLLFLPPIPPSIRVFSNESNLRMRWPKYWCFSFSIIPSKEIPGLISLRTDWLDLLAVQGTLKSLLQHHSSKASILQCSAFFTIQISHPYMTSGKTIDLIDEPL